MESNITTAVRFRQTCTAFETQGTTAISLRKKGIRKIGRKQFE